MSTLDHRNSHISGLGRTGVVILGAVVIVLVIVAGVYMTRFQSKEPKVDTPPVTEVEEVAPDLSDSGRIYVTLSSDSEYRGGDVYAYEFADDRLTKGSADFEDGNYVRYGSVVSPDKTQVAYFVAPRNEVEGADYAFTEPLQLITFPIGNDAAFIRQTNDGLAFKSGIAWSSDNRFIVYEAYTGEFGDLADFEDYDNWSIFIVDTESNSGAERVVTGGGSPKWSPDGSSILFLRNDGLYTYDLATAESVNAVPALAPASRVTRIDVHHESNLLVTNSTTTALEVFDVTSWSPLRLEARTEIAVDAGAEVFWPTFSPDGLAIAVIGQETVITSQYPRVSLVAYDVSTGQPNILYRLDQSFNPEGAILSDWQ